MTTSNEFDESLTVLKSNKAAKSGKKKANSTDEDYPDHSSDLTRHSTTISNASLFEFDPNTLSADGWKKLGLRDKTITTIQNYLSKGGRFRQPEDISKIWGIFPDEVEKLMPYVRIEKPSKDKNGFAKFEKTKLPPKELQPIAINEGDAETWAILPGIGNTLSQRIVKFRDKLGGFYSVEQVGETFGLPDSTFQLIKPMLQISGELKKININTASLEELKAHPYIKHFLANAIVQYRSQHGDYQSVEDLKKIMIMTDELFAKISPYLVVH